MEIVPIRHGEPEWVRGARVAVGSSSPDGCAAPLFFANAGIFSEYIHSRAADRPG